MNKHCRQAFLLAGVLLSGGAGAATETTTINVSASVAGTCTVSTDPIAFGDLPPPGSEVLVNGDVTVNCSNGIGYLVGMDQGQNFDGTFRAMSNGGGDLIRYRIEAPGGTSWGDNGIAGGNFPQPALSGTGFGGNETFPFFAKTNGGGQGVGLNTYTPGTSYSDVVTVTVQF